MCVIARLADLYHFDKEQDPAFHPARKPGRNLNPAIICKKMRIRIPNLRFIYGFDSDLNYFYIHGYAWKCGPSRSRLSLCVSGSGPRENPRPWRLLTLGFLVVFGSII